MKNFSFALLAVFICIPLYVIAFPKSIFFAIAGGLLTFIVSYIAFLNADKNEANRINNLKDLKEEINNTYKENVTIILQYIEDLKHLGEQNLVIGQNIQNLASCISENNITKEKKTEFITLIQTFIKTIHENIEKVNSGINTSNTHLKDLENKISEIKEDTNSNFNKFYEQLIFINEYSQKIESFGKIIENSINILNKIQETIPAELEKQIQETNLYLTDLNKKQYEQISISIDSFNKSSISCIKEIRDMLSEQILKTNDISEEQTNKIKETLTNIENNIVDICKTMDESSSEQSKAIKRQLSCITEELQTMFSQIQEQMIQIYQLPNQEELEIMKQLQKLCSK